MLKILQNIHTKKDTKQDDIPVRIIKENKFTFSNFFLKCLTDTLTITLFLMDLRRLTLSLFIYPFDKNNYRPISILPI